MPRFKSVPKLENLCLRLFCNHLSKCCTLVEHENNHESDETLYSYIKTLPGPLLEQIIPLTIKTIVAEVRKNRGHKGLLKALELMPQKVVKKLDFGALFTDVRLYGQVNSQVKELLKSCMKRLPYLTHLNLSSKCTDEMLLELSTCCPLLEDLNIPISDVTDRGLMALCGFTLTAGVVPGCQQLVKLGVQNCSQISLHGVASVLRNLRNLKYLYYDNLADAINALATIDGDYVLGKRKLKITHLDQFSEYFDFSSAPDLISIILKVCPELESLRFYISDEGCLFLARLPQIKHLQLEFHPSFPGQGFAHLISRYTGLVSLGLTFHTIPGELIKAVADSCPHLELLKLIGFSVASSQLLQPTKTAFQNLKNLEVRLIKQDDPFDEFEEDDEEGIEVDTLTAEFLHFLIDYSFKLEVITIGAVANFLDEPFLHDLLNRNPLSNVRNFHLAISPSTAFTPILAEFFLDTMPELAVLDIGKWNISSKEKRVLKEKLRRKNLDVVL